MYSSHFGLAAFSGAIGESGQTVVQHTPVRMTPSGPVCENGRPFVTDPCTGQAVCMCQVGSEGLPYPASLGSPEGLRSLRHSPGSTEPSAFRSPLTCATGLRPDRESWKAMAPSLAHHYDHSLALHPYSTFYAGLDLNSAARRKAATRETTSPLKAWLSEHRKNPYPTKAEKIMLAIITKMTMTQVSTWFANARRRLKKENKMCWDVNERDEDDKDDDLSEKESNDDKSEGHPVAPSVKSEDEDSEVQLSDISDVEDNVQSAASRLQPDPRVLHSTPRHENTLPTDYSIPHHPVLRTNQSANICVQNRTASAPKPKIWSISHILEPKDDSSTSDSNDTSAVTSSPVIVTSSPVIVTSSRLNHELSSHVTIDHSVHPSVYPASLESPRYRVYEGSQEKTPSPRKTSPGGHPRPPLDTPPDTPPFDNQQQSSTYFKEEKSYEYEALNLKTDRSEESPRT